MKNKKIDCLIIGGGPGGLTAALYLARFRRKVLVCDAGTSRAELISHSFNYPGFTNGVSGTELLAKLRSQAEQFGAKIHHTKILSLDLRDGVFIAASDNETFSAPQVILATGIVDKKPSFPSMKEFIYKGAMRFCPVCDGYEAINKRIAVIGPIAEASQKAIFLHTFSDDITILTNGEDSSPKEKVYEKISGMGIKVSKAHLSDLKMQEEIITAFLADESSHDFDVVYPALGCSVQSGLAKNLGAKTEHRGYLITDGQQETNIPGLYAIGDVVFDLSQICVATGQAAIAATAVHNNLSR
jgi:thioredoxin reductase (NADPH)